MSTQFELLDLSIPLSSRVGPSIYVVRISRLDHDRARIRISRLDDRARCQREGTASVVTSWQCWVNDFGDCPRHLAILRAQLIMKLTAPIIIGQRQRR